MIQSLRFSLAVYAAPHSSQGSQTALDFAHAVFVAGHKIDRVFFYRDGVHTASLLATPPQDERDLNQEWRTLAREHQFELVVCIAAALRRGVLDEQEAGRYSKPSFNLASGFQIAGLGQLLDAAVHSDRLITFGA